MKDPKLQKAMGNTKYAIQLKDLLPFVNNEKLVRELVRMQRQH
jgi:hypothetical protein